MMHMSLVSLIFNILLLCCKNVNTLTFQNMENLQNYLSNSSRNVKPRTDQSHPVIIDILMTVGAIQDYDEISGTLTFTASFVLFWEDETKSWNPEDYGGILATKISVLKTWIPTLILRNGVTAYSLYRYDNYVQAENAVVYYDFYGQATFQVFGQYDVTCNSDVTYYPFDKHTCSIIVITSDILNDLTLTSKFGIHLGTSMPNSEWMIESNDSYTKKSSLAVDIIPDYLYTQDQIEFTLIISRQFFFPLMNIVLPVILLSLVNLIVFLLPVESGERTSFSFTLLLTFVVFMTMVAERLPASNNISLFNVFLLSQLIASILATLFVVLGIRLFYKDFNDRRLNFFYRIILKLYQFSYKDISCRKRVGNQEGNVSFSLKTPSSKELSEFYDRMCIRLFCFGFVVYLFVYGLTFYFSYVYKH